MYLLLLLGLLPFYVKKVKTEANSNIVSVINWLIPLSLITVLGAFIINEWEFLPILYLLLFSMLYLLGKLPFVANTQLRKNGYLVLGSIGTVVMLLLFSFKWIWKQLIMRINPTSSELLIAIVLFIVCVLAFVLSRKEVKKEPYNLFLYISGPVSYTHLTLPTTSRV